MAVSPVVQNTLRQLFKRCVQCPNETPSCPACDDDEYCSQILSSCTTCASAVCVKMDGSSSEKGPKDGPNAGAIAGGVVGGVALVLILAFLMWRFYVKRRRDGNESEQWSQIEQEKANNNNNNNNSDLAMQRDARASTHTVGSMASTVLTRASNIIQIAYIPGVTNRSAPQSPGHLAPPVPPIPAAHSQGTSPGSEEQHFFVPGDLRDSTYSGLSDPRTSYARSSVATTIYRDNAVVSPLPAQTIVRGKAAVVSVKSSNTSSSSPTPGSSTPPVPAIDYGKLEEEGKVQTPNPKNNKFKIQMPHSSDGPSLRPGVSPSGSVRSFQIAKPKALNLVKAKSSNSSMLSSTSRGGVSDSTSSASTPSKERSDNTADRIPITLRPLTEVSVTDSIETAPEDPVSRISDDSSDDEQSTGHRGTYVSTHHKESATSSSSGLQSPFADAQTGEENVDAKTKTIGSDGDSGRARSPFGDEHAVKDD